MYAGSWTLRADPPEFLPDAALVSAGPPRPVGRHGDVRGDLAPPGARREPPEIRGPKMQFCPSPQGGARSVHLRFITVAFTQMGGGHFFSPTNPLFVHLTIKVTERPRNPLGPPPHTPGPPPHVHEPTICPFDHYSDGTSTEPPRTPAPHPGPPPPCPRTHYLSI